jgi:hypothetical protein
VGKDASAAFEEQGHSNKAKQVLSEYKIGITLEEKRSVLDAFYVLRSVFIILFNLRLFRFLFSLIPVSCLLVFSC